MEIFDFLLISLVGIDSKSLLNSSLDIGVIGTFFLFFSPSEVLHCVGTFVSSDFVLGSNVTLFLSIFDNFINAVFAIVDLVPGSFDCQLVNKCVSSWIDDQI